ncbi:MAG TPA: hypothetical protein PLZ36_15985 [Armatimonadota bacterium]|nr:hypothetical protein [Armatimonadota bacterium]HOS43027.1 hypothetical protein [Armatimonadota bacterium]
MREMADIFNEYGLLSAGPHPYTMAALEEDFVRAFPYSVRRPQLFAGLVRLRGDLLSRGLVGYWYVNGSFTTGKPEPDDVDVAVFIEHDLFNTSSSEAQAFVRNELEQVDTAKARYMAHPFLILCCPMTHVNYDAFISLKDYIVNEFVRVKEMPYDEGNPARHRKGYAVVLLGEYELGRCSV